jgi:hypothetical protein
MIKEGPVNTDLGTTNKYWQEVNSEDELYAKEDYSSFSCPQFKKL